MAPSAKSYPLSHTTPIPAPSSSLSAWRPLISTIDVVRPTIVQRGSRPTAVTSRFSDDCAAAGVTGYASDAMMSRFEDLRGTAVIVGAPEGDRRAVRDEHLRCCRQFPLSGTERGTGGEDSGTERAGGQDPERRTDDCDACCGPPRRASPPPGGSAPAICLLKQHQAVIPHALEPEREVGAPRGGIGGAGKQHRPQHALLAGGDERPGDHGSAEATVAQRGRRPHAADLHDVGKRRIEYRAGDELVAGLKHPIGAPCVVQQDFLPARGTQLRAGGGAQRFTGKAHPP